MVYQLSISDKIEVKYCLEVALDHSWRDEHVDIWKNADCTRRISNRKSDGSKEREKSWEFDRELLDEFVEELDGSRTLEAESSVKEKGRSSAVLILRSMAYAQ